MARLGVLDGWRGISIVLVLSGHLLPIGPKQWDLNAAVASTGMAIFFQLSGFLITSVLLRNDNVGEFLIHRVMRIVPLAWLATLITLVALQSNWSVILAHLLFYANKTPMVLTPATAHFWSLCVEVQFYAFVAALVLVGGRRALLCLPVCALCITALRIYCDKPMAINTEFRVDEILAGCTLALAFHHRPGWFDLTWIKWVPFVAAPLLMASASPNAGAIEYARPYLATLLIGSTLATACAKRLHQVLSSAPLRYLALISYALYIVHGCLMGSWLNEGDTRVKYLKRPLFFALTFGLAHLSTRYYESAFIGLGRRWVAARRAKKLLSAT
jgi:peptidoglycan/LPS O-acetylase OafA/YrhL